MTDIDALRAENGAGQAMTTDQWADLKARRPL